MVQVFLRHGGSIISSTYGGKMAEACVLPGCSTQFFTLVAKVSHVMAVVL